MQAEPVALPTSTQWLSLVDYDSTNGVYPVTYRVKLTKRLTAHELLWTWGVESVWTIPQGLNTAAGRGKVAISCIVDVRSLSINRITETSSP